MTKDWVAEYAKYKWYVDKVEELNAGKDFKFPHCDAMALHAPGVCTYCDLYPKVQQWRIDEGMNFTGEMDPTKKPCPAMALRPEAYNKWGGNRAKKIFPHPFPEELEEAEDETLPA